MLHIDALDVHFPIMIEYNACIKVGLNNTDQYTVLCFSENMINITTLHCQYCRSKEVSSTCISTPPDGCTVMPIYYFSMVC